VRRLSVWLVLGSLTISASPTTTTPSRPTRGKAGSGATETVRGRLSVNQRSSPHVSGTLLENSVRALLPSRGGLGRGIDWRGECRAVQAGWGRRGRVAEQQRDLT
jgi:hypothetical protein